MPFAVALFVVSLLTLLLVTNSPVSVDRSPPGGGRIDNPLTTTPPIPTAASPNPDASARAVVTVTARDLADGAPARGLQLCVTPRRARNALAATPVLATTDHAGRVNLTMGSTDTITIEGQSWILPPGSTVHEILASRELWVYRMIGVVGEVQSDDPTATLDPTTVALTAVTIGLEGSGVPGRESPDPWRPLWMRHHGVEEHRDLPAPRPDGSFSVRIPRIQGIALRAAAPGWRLASAVIPTATAPDPTYVRLGLRPSFVVTGVLRTRDGAPIAGARVDVYVSKRMGFAELNLEKLKQGAVDGFTASWDIHKNHARVTDICYADTDENGMFSIESKVDGEILIVVHARGFVPLRKELGWVESRRDEGELVVERGNSAVLSLYYGEKLLAGHVVTVADLSVGDVQPAVEWDADAEGAVSTEWFEVGRRYLVIVRGPLVPSEEFVGGAITWAGQGRLDMREVAARYRAETGITSGAEK